MKMMVVSYLGAGAGRDEVLSPGPGRLMNLVASLGDLALSCYIPC